VAVKILKRLNTSIHRAYYKNISSTRHMIAKVMGAEFVIRPDNYIDRRIWVEGHYEKPQMKYLMRQAEMNAFDALIDVGANFGLYSCIVGRNKLAGHVHAFECDPRNLYRLYGHIEMNGLRDTVTVHAHAVGDRDCEIDFIMAPENNTGRSSVGTGDKRETIKVKQKIADDVLRMRDQNLLIKIDVEGYEENVLAGMENTLEHNLCLVQIEVLAEKPELEEFFTDAGYRKINQIGQDYYFTNMKL
jgi:FkbM family methyltransferase